MEEEVHQSLEETASQDQPNSDEDVEMADEMVPQPESSDPPPEVDTGDQMMSASGGVTVSPEEEEILMGSTSRPEDLSPASETVSVSGELAGLQLASPPRPEMEEEETHL